MINLKIYGIYFSLVWLFCIQTSRANNFYNPKTTSLSLAEIKLIQKIEKSAFKANFKFDDTEINTFKNDFKSILSLYEKIKAPEASKEQTLLEFYIGNLYYFLKEDYLNCVVYLNKAYKNEHFLSDSLKISLYVILADAENARTNYINSIFFYNNSLKLAKQINNHYETYRAIREIGVRYRDLKNYDLAKKYFKQAKTLQKQYNIGGEDAIWLLIHNADMYTNLKNYDFAKYTLYKALKHPDISDYPKLKPYIYTQFTSLWKSLNQIDSLKYYSEKIISDIQNNKVDFQDTLKLVQKYDLILLIPAYNNLGNISLKNQDTINAIQNFKQAFIIGKQISPSEDSSIAAKNLIKLAMNDNNLIIEAIAFLKNYYNNRNVYKKTNLISTKIDEKINTTKIVNNKQENLNFKRIVIFVISPLVIILLYLTFLLYKKHKKYKTNKEEVAKLHKYMIKTSKELHQTNQDLNQFSKIVSQDIKQSIHQIIACSNLLFNTVKTQTNQKNYKSINNDSKKLSNLIDELLENTKNTQKQKTKSQKINFVDLLETVKLSLKNNIMLMNPKINYSKDLPHFWGYRIQMYQLFKNMIENALKYSHPGKQPIINIDIAKNNDLLTIIIADNGIGVPKEKQKEIFNLFSQSSDLDIGKGMGIGLNICNKIVASYNGKINLVSEENNGCTFIMELKEIKILNKSA